MGTIIHKTDTIFYIHCGLLSPSEQSSHHKAVEGHFPMNFIQPEIFLEQDEYRILDQDTVSIINIQSMFCKNLI